MMFIDMIDIQCIHTISDIIIRYNTYEKVCIYIHMFIFTLLSSLYTTISGIV